MQIDPSITPQSLLPALTRLFALAAKKVHQLDKSWDTAKGTPVFTVNGTYTSRGWTEWTQGFQYGCAALTFDATNDPSLLAIARNKTLALMAPHITHIGVHDHGFNNLSTYGNLRRLMKESRIPHNEWELHFYDLALKASGAVQAARWANVNPAHGPNLGYIYSFNGPQSLFIDTIRTTRILGVAHQLGHVLMGENDTKINLLHRSITHGLTSAKFSIYYGEGRDSYDTPPLRGRTTHEALFNTNDGRFRAPNSQQGYSPFSTWTRGLAWAMVGYAEELEFLTTLPETEFAAIEASSRQGDARSTPVHTKVAVIATYEKAARATCDFYLTQAAAKDGICYWDTGAPNLHKLGDYLNQPAKPFNDHEPVDASASAIAAQGLYRLGKYLGRAGKHYTQAALTIAQTLLTDTYLALPDAHQGLLLHSIYHRPNGWDNTPPNQKIPCSESSLWGDYHLLELAVLLQREAQNKPYLTFFDQPK